MQILLDEVDENFRKFFAELPINVGVVIDGLTPNLDIYRASYRRLVSLQAWRSELIEKIMGAEAEAFFKEAQNDALMSHSLARQGAWRVALMCLRSCIENTLYGMYYADHPIELKQWQSGAHRLGFTEAIAYLTRHPEFSGVSEQDSGIDLIKSEYATLSRAVHGSSANFRVTKTGEIKGLNIVSVAELNQWASRERSTLAGLNCALLVLYKAHISGAANVNLRKALSLVIPVARHAKIKSAFSVRLQSIPSVA